jgi:hypothetical protein
MSQDGIVLVASVSIFSDDKVYKRGTQVKIYSLGTP